MKHVALLLASFAFPALVLPTASSNGVFDVDAANGPGTDFVDLELALLTVPAESVVVVRGTAAPGYDYPAITIDKPLVLFGENDPEIAGIDVVGVSGNPVVVSSVTSGPLTIDACTATVIGEYLSSSSIEVVDSTDVRLRRLAGGAIQVDASDVEIVNSQVTGGQGSFSSYPYGDDGILVWSGGKVTVVASNLTAGDGYVYCSGLPGFTDAYHGGDGIRVEYGEVSVRARRKHRIAGGDGEEPCPAAGFLKGSSIDVPFTSYPILRLSGSTLDPPLLGPEPTIVVPELRDPYLTADVAGADVTYTVSGEAGDLATLLLGNTPLVGTTPFGLGDLLTSGEVQVPIGFLDAKGFGSITLPLPGGSVGSVTYAQAVVEHPMSIPARRRMSNSVPLVTRPGPSDFVSPCAIQPLDAVELGAPKSFDASGVSTGGPPIVDWQWDFGDGATASGPVVTHTWSVAGSIPVVLTTTDADGGTYTCNVMQQVLDLSTPCEIAPTQLVDAGEPVTFDGTLSYVSGGTIVDWQWDFGDGNTGSGPTPTHVYTSGGTKTVALTTTASTGLVSTCSTAQEVNDLPACAIDVPFVSLLGLTATVDSASSSDPDGTIVSTHWDLGDGTTSTQASLTHIYPAPGLYTVTLTLADDDGAVSSCSTTIDLEEPCLIASTEGVDVGEAQTFDGSLSSASGATIVDWHWDFGDGATANGPVVSHAWSIPGVFTVTLTTTDSNGAMAACSVPQEVNAFPLCGIVHVDTFPSGVVLIDNTASDSDGSIVSYQWDMGDGTTKTTPTVVHIYASAGTYTVQLTVTDDDGASTSCSEAVVVE